MLKSAASSLRRRRPKATTTTGTTAIEMPSLPQSTSLLAALLLLCYCDSCLFFCYAGKFTFFCIPLSFWFFFLSAFFFGGKQVQNKQPWEFRNKKEPHKRQLEKNPRVRI